MRAALVLVVSVFALAACGGDHVTTADPTPIQSPSTPIQSSSESVSTEPETGLWQEKSKAGAKAFVGHWLGALYVAQSTGEVGPLQEVSHRECVACRDFVKVTTRIYGAGGRYESKPWVAKQKWIDEQVGLPRPRVYANVKVPAATEYATAGAKPTHASGNTTRYAATLWWVDGRWLAYEWEYVGGTL